MVGGELERARVVLKTLGGVRREITAPLDTPLRRVRELAAGELKIEREEATLLAFGRRLGEDADDEDPDSIETLGDLTWAPLGAVDPDPIVLHVVRRMLPHRTMKLKLRLRNRRHEVSVQRSCDIDGLKVAALAAFKAKSPSAEQHEDLRLVFNGRVLDAANGLPLVECGVDDGSVILAVPCADRTREIAMRVKIMGAPATTVKLPASSSVQDVKRMVVTQLPADIIARYPQLPRWQVFLSRGGCESKSSQMAQRMGDEETLALHRLNDSATILFLVPPAGMVHLDVALGPLRVRLPDHKERLIGMDGCYKEQLAQCRKELQAQEAREAERERTEAEREAKRARRQAKLRRQKKLRAEKKAKHDAGQSPNDSPSVEGAPRSKAGGRGLARGFFASSGTPAPSLASSSNPRSPSGIAPRPATVTPARSAPSTPATSPEAVRPPPSWQLQQIQQQKKRRQQQPAM